MGTMTGLITYTTGPQSVMGGSRDFDEKFCGGGVYVVSWDECSASDVVGLGNTCISYLGGFRLGRWDVGEE